MKELILKIIKKSLDEEKVRMNEDEIEKILEIPPSIDFGDYSFPCFNLVEKLKEEPKFIAISLRKNMGEPPKEISEIQVIGPYINFFVDRKIFAEKIIKEIISKRESYGAKKIGKSENVMVEFSQANTHKAFHVGHIRGTSIGESLARMAEFFGDKVIRVNYQGDTGMHVAKWLWCYDKYHSKEKLKKDEPWIASIYVDSIKRLSKNENLQEEVNEINRRLYSGEDEKLNKLWKKTRKFSLDSLEKIYEELNTKFDVYYFESEVEKRGKEISDKLLKKKIASISDGATIINLEEHSLGVWVLLRKDGTVLYSSKDLALSEKKFKDFNLDKSVYVIANEQSLHMKQLIKTLELNGNEKEKEKIKHVSFGEVRLPTGKMSSRTGENILYSDFKKEMFEYAKKQISKRTSKLSKKELDKRALILCISAIKYSMLKQSARKNIIFKKEDALNFEGDSGAYIQYSQARANSILKKARKSGKSKDDFSLEEISTEEFRLIKKLSEFPNVIYNSYYNLDPSTLSNYSFQLSQLFNEFYHACPVIKSEKEEFRILLVKSFKQVIENCLRLLGIEPINEM